MSTGGELARGCRVGTGGHFTKKMLSSAFTRVRGQQPVCSDPFSSPGDITPQACGPKAASLRRVTSKAGASVSDKRASMRNLHSGRRRGREWPKRGPRTCLAPAAAPTGTPGGKSQESCFPRVTAHTGWRGVAPILSRTVGGFQSLQIFSEAIRFLSCSAIRTKRP